MDVDVTGLPWAGYVFEDGGSRNTDEVGMIANTTTSVVDARVGPDTTSLSITRSSADSPVVEATANSSGHTSGLTASGGICGDGRGATGLRYDGKVRVWGVDDRPTVRGNNIGEGELSTTHMVVHHGQYAPGISCKKWVITSIDTDQTVHVILAMSSGKIPVDEVDVTVKRRKGQGKTEYVFVNRVYRAICTVPDWTGGREDTAAPAWLTDEAKAALFTAVYFMGGCDFLPAI